MDRVHQECFDNCLFVKGQGRGTYFPGLAGLRLALFEFVIVASWMMVRGWGVWQ